MRDKREGVEAILDESREERAVTVRNSIDERPT
jgi:hypothetical protein